MKKMEKRFDFTTGKIVLPLLQFAGPVLMALFLQAMYGAVDLLIVGKFASPADVSAVSTGSQIMMTITGLISSLCMGMTIILGQKIGEKKAEEGGRIIGSGLVMFSLIGIIFTVLLPILAPQLAQVMNAPKEAYGLTTNYIRICGGGTLVIIGYNLIALPIGVVVCACVTGIPVSIVESAVLVTAIVTLSFMILATIFPGFFLSMGRALGVGLLVAIIAELVSMLIFRSVSSVFEWIFVAIFSLYIGYDWARANTCARTVNNAIDLAANLYLDIINLFLRILEIMSKRKD